MSGGLQRAFFGNVARISGGAASAHALTLAAMPAITRLFSPEEMGVYGLYASVVALFGSVASLRYEVAMLVPEDREHVLTLLDLSLVTVICFSIIATLVILFAGDSVIPIAGASFESTMALLLVPLGIFSFGLYQALTAFAVKVQTFNAIGASRVAVAAARVAAQLVAGGLKSGPAGLLAGELAGQMLGSALLLKITLNREMKIFRHGVTKLWSAARRYWRFPAFAAPTALVNAIGVVHLPIFLCSYLYGAEQAGHLFLAQKAISIPMLLLGTAIGQVYMSEIAGNRLTGEETYQLFRVLTLRLAGVGVLIGLVTATTAPFLFPFIFGPSWSEAGIYIQSLAIMYAAQFFGAPTAQTLNIYEKPGKLFMWDVSRLVFAFAAFSGSWSAGLSIEHTLLVYAMAQAISYVALVVLVGHVLMRKRSSHTVASQSLTGATSEETGQG